jgi:predicted heme/steroid binding protein
MHAGDLTPRRVFTVHELLRYNGDDGRMYIAHQGIVYDVTDCPKWRSGLHENLHFPGQDLTCEFTEAPHGMEVFDHPCVRRIGSLESDQRAV